MNQLISAECQAVRTAMKMAKRLGAAWGFGAVVLGGEAGTTRRSAWQWADRYVKDGTGMIGAVIPAGPDRVRIVIVFTRNHAMKKIERLERDLKSARKMIGGGE